MTKLKTERGIKEESALIGELANFHCKYNGIIEQMNDRYRALADLRKDEDGYFNKLDNDDEDFFGV